MVPELILLTLNRRGTLSAVPIKFKVGVVPELPVNPQPAPAPGSTTVLPPEILRLFPLIERVEEPPEGRITVLLPIILKLLPEIESDGVLVPGNRTVLPFEILKLPLLKE